MPNPQLLTEIAGALSARLATWQAVATPLVASGLEVSAWNGRRVLRLEIRPALRGRADREWDLFSQENGLLVQIERECPHCFSWDDGHFAAPDLLGDHGISHYLCDLAHAADLLAALARRPSLSDTERDRFALELTGPRPSA